MKLERLMGIVIILLQGDKITAPELASRFEVSRRTINRDVEDICRAGIPIITTQGVGGGISISDNYKLNKTIFTDRDLKAVLAGLYSLDSVSYDKKYKNIIDKFVSSKNTIFAKNNIIIDLASPYKNTVAPKIALLQYAIENSNSVTFTYHNSKGENQVELAPYVISFQWGNWYVLGVDYVTDDFKLYKLNRICDLLHTENHFDFRDIPDEKLDFNSFFTDEIKAVIIFEKSEKYKLIEDYGQDSIVELENGSIRFSFSFTSKDYLLSWVLSFGDRAELIEPAEYRLSLKQILINNLNKYI